MQTIFYILAILFLLLFLNFLHQLVMKYFSLASFLTFRTSRVGVYFYFLFFLPGVIFHELGHLFSASFLGVPTGKLEIFPQKSDDGWTLGRVSSAETDLLRSSLIGLAPMVVGVTAIAFITRFGLNIKDISDFFSLSLNRQSIIWFYLVLTFTNTMFLSKEDKTTIWALPSLLIILFFLVKAMGLAGILVAVEGLFLQVVSPLVVSFSLTVFLDVVFLAPLVVLTEILAKLRG